MPEISGKEMAQLARRWSRGTRAFRRLYDEGPIVPETGVHLYSKKDVDPQMQELADACDADRFVEFMNTTAVPKDARAAKFQIIFCLGGKILAQEEAARIVLFAKPRVEEVKPVG